MTRQQVRELWYLHLHMKLVKVTVRFIHRIFLRKDDFSVVVDYDKIEQKKCSFSAGQYFEVKIEYVELTQEEFQKKMDGYTEKLTELFAEGNALQTEILEQLKKVKYE